MERGKSNQHGGIIALAQVIGEHESALNYDLMTRAGRSIREVPGTFDWADIRDFITHLDAGSALVAELEPDAAGWQGTEKVPMLLAHIADTLAALSYGYTLTHMKKGAQKPQPPQPIPRPGVEAPRQRTQTWGSDGLPISEFLDWWDRTDERGA